jgi:hypothetical protein
MGPFGFGGFNLGLNGVGAGRGLYGITNCCMAPGWGAGGFSNPCWFARTRLWLTAGWIS